MLQETGERGAATGAADDPAMQADAQHLWRRVTFLEKAVDTVAEVFPEFLRARPARTAKEFCIVGIELVRHDELVPLADLHPVGHLVSV